MKLPYKFGKYVLLEKIAEGGMAEIYKARYKGEQGFSKFVAIKKILSIWSARKDFKKMLIDEANALVHLQHQNIVQVYELGSHKDFFYISMEYVKGLDLRQLTDLQNLQNIKLPEKYVCFIVSEILKGLDFAHKQEIDVVHRDISPQNILISESGEVKITDFGIAKGLHRDQVTITKELKGKLAYMSPEQVTGATIDSRSDLYSVAIILYELITGCRLFYSENDFETIEKVRASEMPFEWEEHVSIDMQQILKKALSRDPKDRYQNAIDLLRDLNLYVTANKLYSHSIDLSDYLKNISKYKKRNKNVHIPKTRIVSEIKGGVVQVRHHFVMPLVIILLIVFAGIAKSDTWQFSSRQERIAASKPPVIDYGVINIDTEPTGANVKIEFNGKKNEYKTPFVISNINLDKEINAKLSISKQGFYSLSDEFELSPDNSVFSKTYNLKSNMPAKINVQVRPWGYVYIPGVIKRKESPVHNLMLSSGKYEIKVFYEPKNLWVKKKLQVEAGKNYQCIANFMKKARISCH